MKIKFKDKEGIDFKKIFPVIDPEDYEVIAGHSINIDQKTFETFEKSKYLELAGYQISADLIEIDQAGGLSKMQTEIQKEVSKKFIYSEPVVDVLVAGIEAQRNVLLWGRGGHGKSEITELVLRKLYEMGHISEPPFIQAFGDGLTDEKLFGGMNIKKYKEHGVIEYLPENSFMNHEVVVFEEIFDAPASTLLSLKDIMTSKQFRQGNEVYNVKTKVYIGLTNRSKAEFAESDDSLKALAERFALTYKTEWAHYTKKDFIALYKCIFGQEYFSANQRRLTTLANIIEMNNTDGTSFVSPRTAVAAADLYVRGKNLEYISDLDPEIIRKYQSQIIEDERSKEQQSLLAKMESYITTHELEFVEESEEFLRALNQVEQDISGKSINLEDLDFGSKNDNEVKINKCKYLLSVIDRQNLAKSTNQSFMNLKKRVNGIVQTLSQSQNE